MAQRQREYAIRYYIAIKVVCLSAFSSILEDEGDEYSLDVKIEFL